MLLNALLVFLISYLAIVIECSLYKKGSSTAASSKQKPSLSTKSAEKPSRPNECPSIVIEGNKFYYANDGSRFYIKGIAYQQTADSALILEQKLSFQKEQNIIPNLEMNRHLGSHNSNISDASYELNTFEKEMEISGVRYVDPLADETSCLRDIPHFIDLNVNVIRVYSIDPKANHAVCMSALANAGIYVLVDLSEPFTSINRQNPSWDTDLFDRYKAVVDSLAKYNNVLGFFAGNEVTNDKTNTEASAFVKAAIRDTKAYIQDKNYRKIPVGYASNDDEDIRQEISQYFICGDESMAADFFGVNIYEWCGYSSFHTSGYKDRTVEFQDFKAPVFFSEFGCNKVRPRPFQEVETLFSPLMTNIWSGGIVYMYFEEENQYGVVKVNDDKISVKKMEDYRYLRDAYANVHPKITKLNNDKEDTISKNNRVACPKISETWKASNDLPQTPFNFKCECLETSLDCIVSPKKNKHDFTNLFSYLCSHVDCSEINSNATEGFYGYYSDCDDKQKLSYILNKYYDTNNKDPQACSFGGEAALNKYATSKQSLDSISKNGQKCSSILKNLNDEPSTNGKNKNSDGNGVSDGKYKVGSSSVKLSFELGSAIFGLLLQSLIMNLV